MMLYHPDRANFHINEINELASQENYDGLLEYSHILLLSRIDEIADAMDSYEDIDYSPVYEWDFNTEGFTIFDNSETKENEKSGVKYINFYDAIKLRMYESTDQEFPAYYLEDIDEFELASSDINDLEGVEFCKHVKTLDLSDNHIYDLTPLFGLTLLEEINLSDNDIIDIDTLSNLENLKVIHLANNSIDDISSIMNLPRLEYADLRGTKVSGNQIEELKELGVTVEF
jgi:Leucine-rich repeat (LRR) protein